MPRHFSKIMHSPYFQSEHYANSDAAKFEKRVENFFKFKSNYESKKFKKIRRKDCLAFEEFDKKYNVKTAHAVVPVKDGSGDLGPGIEHNNDKYPISNGYQVCPLEYIDQISKSLSRINNIQNYQFVDVGSGKGKIIFYNILKKYPFSSYVGIEIDKELHSFAESNLKTTNIEIDKDVKFINIDAFDYKPEVRESVYFMFRPFSEELHRKFIIQNKDVFLNSPTIIVLMCPFEDSENSIEKELGFKVYKKTFAFTIYKNN